MSRHVRDLVTLLIGIIIGAQVFATHEVKTVSPANEYNLTVTSDTISTLKSHLPVDIKGEGIMIHLIYVPDVTEWY